MDNVLDLAAMVVGDSAPCESRVDGAHHRVERPPGVPVGQIICRHVEGNILQDLVKQRSGFPAAWESSFRQRVELDRRHWLAVKLVGLDRSVAAGRGLFHA